MDIDETLCVNKAGLGVAMNNSVSTTSGTSTTAKPTNVNNIHDVQKLQQQLQDIKEQVSLAHIFISVETSIKVVLFRQCVQCVSIESKIWCSCVVMERVKCVVIKSKDVPFAGKLLKNVFCYFKFIMFFVRFLYLYSYEYATGYFISNWLNFGWDGFDFYEIRLYICFVILKYWNGIPRKIWKPI